MAGRGTFTEHFWVSQGMAKMTGHKLNMALASGVLDHETYEEALLECCKCTNIKLCISYLADPKSADKPVPEFCRLSKLLGAISKVE